MTGASNVNPAMARQYSETSARLSGAIDRQNQGKKPDGNKTEDLKKELEMWEHKVSVEELCSKLGTHAQDGLSEQEAKVRLERDGPNLLSCLLYTSPSPRDA